MDSLRSWNEEPRGAKVEEATLKLGGTMSVKYPPLAAAARDTTHDQDKQVKLEGNIGLKGLLGS